MIALLAMLANVATGEDQGIWDDGRDRPPERPHMPTVEEAELITESQSVVHYPRIVPIIGYGLVATSTGEITRSMNRVRNSLGLGDDDGPSSVCGQIDFVMRLDLSYGFRIAAGSVVGVGSGDIERFWRIGVVATKALTPEHLRGICVSAGLGIGRSQVEYTRSYDAHIPGSNSYLRGITWASPASAVFPLQVVAEIPNLRYARGAIVITTTYQLGPTESETVRVYQASESIAVPMKVQLSGWMLSAGLAVGF